MRWRLVAALVLGVGWSGLALAAAGYKIVTASERGTYIQIGRDIAKVQYGWPVGLPLCRPLSAGLWEVRSSLPSRREARVFFGFHDGMLIALHAMIKKTQKTLTEDLTLARHRFKELQSWQGKTRTQVRASKAGSKTRESARKRPPRRSRL